MDVGNCHLIGSALVEGLKTSFLILLGLAVVITPALVATHVLLKRASIAQLGSINFVVHGLVYFALTATLPLITIAILLAPVWGPYVLVYYFFILGVGMFPLVIYLWRAHNNRYPGSKVGAQRVVSSLLIMGMIPLAVAIFLIDPVSRSLIEEEVIGSYISGPVILQYGFTEEQCFERDGQSFYFKDKNNPSQTIEHYPDGTSRTYRRW